MKIFKDLILLFSSQGIVSLMNFLVQIILVRSLTTEDYGTFTTLMTTITLLATINGFGINGYLLRIFSVYGKKALKSVKYVRWILLCSSVLTVLIWVCLYFILKLNISFSLYLSFVIPLLCYGLLPTVTAINQIADSMMSIATWRILNRTILFSSVLTSLILNYDSLFRLSVIFIVLSFISLLIITFKIMSFDKSVKVLNPRYKDISYKSKVDFSFKRITINSSPYMFLGLFYLMYYQSDLILLNVFEGNTSVAIYNIAFLIISILYMLLALIFNIYLLPGFHVRRNQNYKTFHLNIKKMSRFCGGIGMIFMFFIFITADFTVPLLFGETYQASSFYLKILALAIPFRFVSTSLSSLLLDEKSVWFKVKYQGLAALFNFIANLMIIPIFGIVGAVITTVLTEILVCFLYYMHSRRSLNALSN